MTPLQQPYLDYRLTLGIVAMEGRGFEYPSDSFVAENDKIYVTNKSRDYGERGVRVTILDIDSEYFGTFGHYGVSEGQLISPAGITGDGNGNLYVTDDYANMISQFDLEGNFIQRWGAGGSNLGELNGPSGIAVGIDSYIYVSDTKNHRIQIFTLSGDIVSAIGSQGEEEGNFHLPWGVDVGSDGKVSVADWGNNRIQRFDSNGEHVETISAVGTSKSQLNHPSSIVVDSRGNRYIADWGNETVKVLNSSSELIQEMKGQATLSKWASAFLETNKEEGLSRENANLDNLSALEDTEDPHTVSAHIEKLFWSPVSVKLQKENLLLVTESNRHRIQVYEIK